MMNRAFAAAVIAAGCASVWLAIQAHSSHWTMEADESVHAIDGLRLYDDLHHGRAGAFLKDTYFSERWQPPVNDHLRWYPFVHSWVLAASFLIMGPSDFSARLPSVVFLFGSALLFYAIAWRIAPSHKPVSGLLAVLFLLTAPNIVSFFATGVTEAVVFFACYLALLAYLWFLEKPESSGRAMLTGAAVAAAILTKYDHGILLALAIGVFEIGRARFNLRTMPWPMLGAAAIILAAWFAHPDKIAALLDASRHPFMGNLRNALADDAVTWFVEYSSDPVIAMLMIFSIAGAYRYRHTRSIPAVWTFAVVSSLFLMTRGRFRHRYNIVEAPAFVLLVAALLPGWIAAAAQKLQTWSRALAAAIVLAGCAGTAAGIYWMRSPHSLFSAFARLFTWFYDLRPEHWGLKLVAGQYIAYFATLRPGFDSAAVSMLAVGAAVIVAGIAAGRKQATAPALAIALAVSFVPGAAVLYAHAGELIDWEIGGSPAVRRIPDLVEKVVEQQPGGRTEILLGGGWNNLVNNALRWYLLTGYGPRNFDDIHVWGSTIGTIVLPAAPRVEYWAEQLEHAPAASLPDIVVLIHPERDFLYKVDFDQDAEVYPRILAARDVYRLAEEQEIPELRCRVAVYRVNRASTAAAVDVDTTLPPPVPVSPDGWIQTEDPWRQFWNPLLK